jgi:uncharacterized membrane protein
MLYVQVDGMLDSALDIQEQASRVEAQSAMLKTADDVRAMNEAMVVEEAAADIHVVDDTELVTQGLLTDLFWGHVQQVIVLCIIICSFKN